MRTTIGLVAVTLTGLGVSALMACGGDNPPPAAPTTTSAQTAAPPPVTPPPAETASAAPVTPPAPTAVFHLAGFQTPESVLWDDAADRYLVSNINGKPDAADGNGYISDVSPDGKLTTEKWIEGGKNKVTLNAPKGTGITNGLLYVADLDNVRMFDVKTGAPKGNVKIPGATFLNDIAIGADGKVYVSDTGIKFTDKGPAPTGTDAVWMIEKNKATKVAKSKELHGPNGLLVGADGVWTVTFGAPELYRLDAKGAKQDVTKLPKGMLDGIVQLGDGSLLISSWEDNGVYRGKPNGEFTEAFANLKSPGRDRGGSARRPEHDDGKGEEAHAKSNVRNP
ncbi:MAG: SMP-30/gluconolactonase/LRE family protein [Polyangiaceae bacterium]